MHYGISTSQLPASLCEEESYSLEELEEFYSEYYTCSEADSQLLVDAMDTDHQMILSDIMDVAAVGFMPAYKVAVKVSRLNNVYLLSTHMSATCHLIDLCGDPVRFIDLKPGSYILSCAEGEILPGMVLYIEYTGIDKMYAVLAEKSTYYLIKDGFVIPAKQKQGYTNKFNYKEREVKLWE